MAALTFDREGHLTPYEAIETDWQSFVETFGWSEHRTKLLNSLQLLCVELTALFPEEYIVWIDGSFGTRTNHPNDLDVVFMLPASR